MDNFKQHLQQHKAELDIDEPSPIVWQGINKQLDKPKSILIPIVYLKWAAAACIALLIGLGYFIYGTYTTPNVVVHANKTINSSTKNDTASAIHQPTNDVTMVDTALHTKPSIQYSPKTVIASSKPTFKKDLPKHQSNQGTSKNDNLALLNNVEKSFGQVINLQKARINTTPLNAENPTYFNDFYREIRSMDTDEQTIKHEMKKLGVTPEMLDRLITIYQQKLNVLKQLQTEIQKTNNRFNKGRTPVEAEKIYFLHI